MLRSSRTLGVDYESLIVWGMVAHQNVAHLMPPLQPPAQATTPRSDVADQVRELRPVRIRDLHQITGIPRETIRRKLEALAKRGFVRRHQGAGWIIDRQSIEPDLREFTRESVRQFLACADQIQTVLENSIAGLPARQRHATLRGSPRHEGGRRPTRDTSS
jgi:predicted ArsR family transcriptional regulator